MCPCSLGKPYYTNIKIYVEKVLWNESSNWCVCVYYSWQQWPGSLQSADDDEGCEGGEQFGSGSTGGSNVDRTWVLGLQIDSIPFNSMVHLYHQLF